MTDVADRPVCYDPDEPALDEEAARIGCSVCPEALLPDRRFSSREKFLLMILCALAMGRVRSWPPDAELRARGGFSPKWIKKTLAKLADAGWVEVEHRPGQTPSRVVVLPFYRPDWEPDEGMRPAIDVLREMGEFRENG